MRRSLIAGLVVLVFASILSGPGAMAEPGHACDHGLQRAAYDPEHGPLCSHGDDPARDADGETIFPADAGPVPAAPCTDNGANTNRIEVIYGHPSDVANNYAASVPAIRNAVAFADSYFEGSDAGTSQHLRWLCSGGQVVVHNVTLAPIGSDGLYTFSDMYGSLATGKGNGKKASGFRARDRIYVTFVDGISNVYSACGQGNFDSDDSPGLTNRNNTGPAYSLIACWNGTTTLHEIGHNIGAVQYSAPHTSGAAHCYDEIDVMCYDDGGSYFLGPDGQDGTADDRTVQVVCADPLGTLLDPADKQFDCNQDDYYDPSPAAGSYLATHWNVANSFWVQK